MKTRPFGLLGENYAAKMLQRLGYKIVKRNYRCKIGEIDIIALDKYGVLVFVEVKARTSKKYGNPEEAVTKRKIAIIKRVAQYFLQNSRNAPKIQRIEVVSLVIENNKVLNAKIIKDI